MSPTTTPTTPTSPKTAARPRISTLAIHAGLEPDASTGAVSPPVFQTSTYAQEELGRHQGYEYGRTHNPTRERLERSIAALEGAKHGICYASGLSAIDALLRLLSAGDHVVSSSDLYGGTYRLFERVYTRYGLTFTYVDSSDEDEVARALRPETKLLYLETPTNPLMKITDLARMSELARGRGIVTAVDNTFLSPALQRPLEFGIDVTLHSTTKYLNGHSDLIGGAIATSRDDLAERQRFLQNAVGAVPAPWDCWLALRGIRTLALRMERHDRNGRELADWLAKQSKVQRVIYPGLASHPQHALAERQMDGYGGMISIELGSMEAANRFLRTLRVFTLAESLGGVESLACHPASMTHASVPREMREAAGFTDGLVRLSVGCEDVRDLLDDLQAALAAV